MDARSAGSEPLELFCRAVVHVKSFPQTADASFPRLTALTS